MISRHERDSVIGNIFRKHNLGSLPEPPFTNDMAANLTNRIKARLMDLEKDLTDTKVRTLHIYFRMLKCN